ncbi:cobaltochelatase subunit CobN [Roseicitreum antarcticum]|uniref:CobN/Magnesium Chelatase n=1 Tax=Roseicitreum antarcticum TaxID=564137 RepID=A0A1H2UCM5_9RHOB|nr:CobN/Magnesium Chelatase [Roseicitreum antarcticum]
MHVIFRESHGLDQADTPTDLGQTPADLVVLSFSDSDLGAFAAGWHAGGGVQGRLPTLRLANLAALKHPLSVDTYVDATLRGAKGVLIRLIGGVPYWSYGLQQVRAQAQARGIALAVLPADGRADPRLDAMSTLPVSTLRRLQALCDTGGAIAAQAALAQLALAAGLYAGPVRGAKHLPPVGAWSPNHDVACPVLFHQPQALPIAQPEARPAARPRIAIVFYRSYLVAADLAPVAALHTAFIAQGYDVLTLFVPSLKEPQSAGWLRRQLTGFAPRAIVNATAFSGKGDDGTSPLDGPGVPVFQVALATSDRAAWEAAARGLSPADLAMHVVLPEVDGRIMTGVASFKEPGTRDPHLQFARRAHQPDPARIRAIVARVDGWLRLAAKPVSRRRVALILSTYPGRDWNMGHAVGLDAPASARAILEDLHGAGYDVGETSGARAGAGTGKVRAASSVQVTDQSTVSGRADIPEGGIMDGGEAEGRSVDNRSTKARSADANVAGAATDNSATAGQSWALVGPEALRGAQAKHGVNCAAGGAAHYTHQAARAAAPAAALHAPRNPTVSANGLAQDDAAPQDARDSKAIPRPDLTRTLQSQTLRWPLTAYRAALARLPQSLRDDLTAAWGSAEADPNCRAGAFHFSAVQTGQTLIALQPERGTPRTRGDDYHDLSRTPRHAYVAFYLWLQTNADAMVHIGAHGTLEWLPGKSVALSDTCWPEVLTGPLPVIYPFIVNDPGEAAQAKRRIGAVTLGHIPPPLRASRTPDRLARLEALLDEFSTADGLDPKRRDRLQGGIRAEAQALGVEGDLGLDDATCAAEAITRIDRFVCDVKESQFGVGLHVWGRDPVQTMATGAFVASSDGGESPSVDAGVGAASTGSTGTDPQGAAGNATRPTSHAPLDTRSAVRAERAALLDALDGRRIAAGPSGSPYRGRVDVLPTGRNMFTTDPRAVPSRAAYAQGVKLGAELVRRHLQDEGDWPRALIVDLWGSATMRTAGEEFAMALHLIGVRPVWDAGSERVSGIEVIPIAELDHPRVDVTLRVSGLFRDVFPSLSTLFATAIRALAARDEAPDWNPFVGLGSSPDTESGAAEPDAEGLDATGPGAQMPAPRLQPSSDQSDRGPNGTAAGSATTANAGAESGSDTNTAPRDPNLFRVYGPAPGSYGLGAGAALEDYSDEGRAAAGAAWLNASAFALEGDSATRDDAGIRARVAAADSFVHLQDLPETDLLMAADYATHEAGFAAAQGVAGGRARLYHMDTTRADTPRARALSEEIARVVQARAANPDWIAGMRPHGFRGAAEIAATLEHMAAFAHLAGVVGPHLFDLYHEATLGCPTTRAFLQDVNPAACRAMQDRFAALLEAGLWQTRRNSIRAEVEAMGDIEGPGFPETESDPGGTYNLERPSDAETAGDLQAPDAPDTSRDLVGVPATQGGTSDRQGAGGSLAPKGARA